MVPWEPSRPLASRLAGLCSRVSREWIRGRGVEGSRQPGWKWGGGLKREQLQSSDYHERPSGQCMSRSGHLSSIKMIYTRGIPDRRVLCQVEVLPNAEMNSSLNAEKWE